MTGSTAAHSVVEPSRLAKRAAVVIVILYALISMVPLLWILLTELQDAARFDQLSAEDSVSAVARRLCQPFHDAHAPDARVHRHAAARRDLVRPAGALAQHGDRGSVQLPAALRQLAHHRLRLDLPGGRARHARSLRLLALQSAAQGRSAVLHPVDPDDAADRGRDPDLSDVSRTRPDRHQTRHDPALHRRQRLACGVAAEGLHRRDPARIRRSRDDRRLYAAAGVPQRWSCRRRRPASPRPQSSA